MSAARHQQRSIAALSLVLAVCLGACGSSSSSTTSTTSAQGSSTSAQSTQTSSSGSSQQSSTSSTSSRSPQLKTSTRIEHGPVAAPPEEPVHTKTKAAFEGFVTCMRKNGINYPSFNLSGHGPVVDTSKLHPNSPQFKAAQAKCTSALASELHRLGVYKTKAPSH